ncbi:hypothetical protein D3C84_1077970 [compost metagenome]
MGDIESQISVCRIRNQFAVAVDYTGYIGLAGESSADVIGRKRFDAEVAERL